MTATFLINMISFSMVKIGTYKAMGLFRARGHL